MLTNNICISYHETYPTPGRPFNVLGQELQRKRDIVASYFSVAVELGSFTESHWNGNWIPRRYQRTGHVHDNRPDWQALPFELVNALTFQCLTSKGVGTNPILSACTGAKIQKWTYVANNAQLVSTSGNCISFGNGLFIEESCAPHSNQYWTPWDFGIIRAPGWTGYDGKDQLNNCLNFSAGNGSLPAISNSCDTTASRWSLTRDSAFQDLRQENALIDDFNNDGNDDLLLIQRHHHLWNFADSGFDVLVTDPATQNAATWYKCTNSIDYPNEICSQLNLAFDDTWFLSGDFDGDGFADLMVITRKNYGAAFWLLRE